MRATFKQDGFIFEDGVMRKETVDCQLTSDSVGKTLSVRNNDIQFTIGLEPVLRMLKKEYN